MYIPKMPVVSMFSSVLSLHDTHLLRYFSPSGGGILNLLQPITGHSMQVTNNLTLDSAGQVQVPASVSVISVSNGMSRVTTHYWPGGDSER